jgi:two-component system cell cycle sensor histidine kinase/response regulator CckA
MTSGKRNSGIFSRKVKALPWPLMLIFLFLIAAIIVSGIFYYQKQKQAALHEQTAQLQAVADLKAGEIRNWLTERLNDARLVTENRILTVELLAFLDDRRAGPHQESILGWMRSLQNNYDYQNIMLLDKSGQVALVATSLYPAIGSEGVKLLEAARSTRSAVRSDLHSNPSVPNIHMDVVAPLLAADKVAGFVLMRIDPTVFLFPKIKSWPTPSPSAETLLVRRDGDSVLYLNDLRHRKDTALKLRFPLTAKETPAVMAVLGKTGAVSGQDYRGIAVWAVLEPVPASNWFIVAKIDREEIEFPIRRDALTVLITTMSLLLAAAMFVLILWVRQRSRFRLRQLEAENHKQALVQHFDYLTRYANDIILLCDEKMNILETNERAILTYGYGREALLKMNLRDLRAPGERDKLAGQMMQVVKKLGMLFETTHRKKDGAAFPVESSIRFIEANGKKYFQDIVRDISERKRAEEQIKSQLQELQRWQEVILGREDRVISMKKEVNELCRRLGETPRYASQETGQEAFEIAKDPVP